MIAAAAAAAGIFMYGRAERVSAQSIQASQVMAEQRKLPQWQFGDLIVVPLDDQATLQSTLHAAMAAHTFGLSIPASASDAKAMDAARLATEVSQFLHLRYADQDASAYLSWRRVPGVEWADRLWLSSTWFAAKEFEALTGNALTDGVPTELVFTTLFDGALKQRSERRTLLGVCPDGVRVAKQVQTGGNAEYPYLSVGRQSPDVSDDLWYGSRGATMRPWFACKARRLALLQRGFQVPVAVVGLPMVNEAGERIPVVTEWFFDAPSSRWILEAMYINNYEGPDDFGTLNF
jgi:hypothetical protein